LIRKARYEDLELIREIESSVFQNPWTLNQFKSEFDKDFSKFYVFEIEKKIIGYVILWDLGDTAEIANIAVEKSSQRKGFAKLLLEYVLKKCKFNVECFLEVDENNFRAVSFYKKMGFKEVSVRKDYYGKNINALIMKLTKKEVPNAKSG
jgi:ribosomal-protein-alanine N-acetyltransferase